MVYLRFRIFLKIYILFIFNIYKHIAYPKCKFPTRNELISGGNFYLR